MLLFFAAAFALDTADCVTIHGADQPFNVRPVADLDGDTVTDVAVVSLASLTIYLSSHAGPGLVLPHLNGRFQDASGGDLNADGWDDLLVTTQVANGPSEVTYYPGPLSPGFLPPPAAWWSTDTANVEVVGDMNADGQNDVGYVHQLGSLGYNESEWRSEPGQDVLGLTGEVVDARGAAVVRWWDFHDEDGGYWYVDVMTVRPAGDFDGDGRTDMVFGTYDGLKLVRGREVTAGAPRVGRTFLSDEYVTAVDAGFDAQGDGFGDVLALSGSRVWMSSGGTQWRLGRIYDEAGTAAVWRLPSRGSSVAYAGDRFGNGEQWMLVETAGGLYFSELPRTTAPGNRALPTNDPLTVVGGPVELDIDRLGWSADIDGDGNDELLLIVWSGAQKRACAL